MSKMVVSLGAVLALLLGLGLGAAFRTPLVDIRVTMAEPVVGVAISVDGELQGETNHSGKFTVRVRARIGDEVELRFTKERYLDTYSSLYVTSKDNNVSQVTMSPAPINVFLVVTAVDASGKFVESATVLIDDKAVGTTDATGTWRDSVLSVYNGEFLVGVQGVPEKQRVVANQESVALSFVEPEGIPLLIKAKHNISNVEIIWNGEVLGRTNKNGTSQVLLPGGTKQFTLSFNLPGCRIADWTVTNLRKGLTHTLKIHPLGNVDFQVKGISEDGSAASGYTVSAHGRTELTDMNGSATLAFKQTEVLVGQRVGIRLSKGELGFGRGTVTIVPTKRQYRVDVNVVVPKKVRFTIADENGELLPNVIVNLEGDPFATTDQGGIAEGNVTKLDVEYRFTFQKTGYTYRDDVMAIRPRTPLTERQLAMQSLAIIAAFIDSISERRVSGLEVWQDGSRLFTTEGVGERIAIPHLGAVTFELRGDGKQYPQKQEVTVNVTEPEENLTVKVMPNPKKITLRFVNKGGGNPLRNRDVRLKGAGYLKKGRTDADGSVEFTSFDFVDNSIYEAELLLAEGSFRSGVRMTDYTVSKEIPVDLSGNLTVRTLPGQESVRLSLYPTKRQAALKTGLIVQGTGEVKARVEFGDYYLIVEGQEAVFTEMITVNKRLTDREIDAGDPFLKGNTKLAAGDSSEAMSFFRKVPARHPSYTEAQKQLCFYHNTRELSEGEANAAQEHCNTAAQDKQAKSDPHLFLACLESSHKAGKYDEGLDCATKAIAHERQFDRSRRELLQTRTYYYQALCLHDKFFHNPPTVEDDDDNKIKCSQLDHIRVKWENFEKKDLSNEQLEQAQDRRFKVESEWMSLRCQ